MARRTLAFVFAFVFAMQVPIGQVLGTAAALAAGSNTNPCHDPTPAKYLPAVDPAPLDPATARTESAAKEAALALDDPEKGNRDLSTGTADAFAREVARKDAILATLTKRASVTILPDRATLERECSRAGISGPAAAFSRLADSFSTEAAASFSSGSGYAWVDYINQQGQQDPTWCGPATVSEMATTEANNGMLTGPVSQTTAATYMGTNADGTTVGNQVAGINNYVAQPIVHWNYFAFVWVSTSPTSTDNTNFYELAYQPHLVGHPQNQTIHHWFQVGGYQQSGAQAYYSDSATTVWSTVSAFSWFDLPTMVGILGGFGYAW